MPERYIYKMFHLDTNRINAKQRLDNMNTLEEWHNNNVINLEMSEVSKNEACAGNNVPRRKKAFSYIYSLGYSDTPEEKALLDKIENIIFPDGAKDQNQRNDVEVVFHAAKYHRILITNDGGSKKQPGGILGNAEQLMKEVGVKIVTDDEAIIIVRNEIDKRDQRARYILKNRGGELPDWIEKD